MTKTDQHCEVECLLKIIGGRWKIVLLRELSAGPMRHGQLLRALSGITQKMLTQRLRELETDGLLSRTDLMEGRVKLVEYALSDWGQQVMQIVWQLHDWSSVNRQRLLRAQERL